jgi:predicted acyl esterase
MQSPHFVDEIQYEVSMSPLPESVVVEHDVPVVMRDGVTIRVNVYRPAKEGRFPVIMATSPYGKDAFKTIEIFSHVPRNHIGHIDISDHVTFEAPDPGFWVPNDYVIVQVDTRGQGTSEGTTTPFGPVEQQDYVELIAWASAQPWSNGNVGLCGVSYLAISQWLVAQHRPPQLKAIIPWEGYTDFYLRAFPGGIPEVKFWPWVMEAWIATQHNPAFPLLDAPPPAEHPLKGPYWTEASPRIENIDVPALICASFSDQGLHSRDCFVAYGTIGSQEKWLWSHRQPKWHAFYSAEALDMQKRFFDRFLAGRTDALDGKPRVHVEINESRDVYTLHEADQWPLPGTRYEQLFLGSDGLSATPVAAGSVSYIPDADGRATFDVRFDEDTQVVGHAKLKLWVEADGADDMDLFAGLKKLDANGDEVYFYGFGGANPNDVISRGWLRASHRELDAAASTPYLPVHRHTRRQPLAKGEIVPVEIELLPSATLFRKGETLRVVVQGQTLAPNAVLLELAPENSGAHIIHFGGDHDSHLLMPVLPADAVD